MLSLLDVAVRKSSEGTGHGNDTRTLVFAGSKGAGKTSIIERFVEKKEPVKETVGLEYSFARKSGRSLTKEVCHIWELGGGSLFSPLLPCVFGNNINYTTLILVLDLSSPKTLWTTLETTLQVVYNHITKARDASLEKSAKDRVPADHEDKETITPFPVPLVIIGGKYDLFVNMDPEDKKIITRCLRLVAHSLAGSLVYYSDDDTSLVKKIKDVLNYHGFGSSPWKGFNSGSDKPLSIPFGADSFQQIYPQIVASPGTSGMALERFKHAFTDHFPQDTVSLSHMPDDPASDPNFKEPLIDNLRAQKEEELDRIIRGKESKKQ